MTARDDDPPAGSSRPMRLDPEAVRTARLLAEGLTDAAVARDQGVDERTVRRRVAVVMDALDARTRFQAGYRFCMHEQEPPKRT